MASKVTKLTGKTGGLLSGATVVMTSDEPDEPRENEQPDRSTFYSDLWRVSRRLQEQQKPAPTKP